MWYKLYNILNLIFTSGILFNIIILNLIIILSIIKSDNNVIILNIDKFLKRLTLLLDKSNCSITK